MIYDDFTTHQVDGPARRRRLPYRYRGSRLLAVRKDSAVAQLFFLKHMQIAGTECSICRHKITLSTEGKYCEHCSVVVHRDCEPSDKCSGCGQSFHFFERPSIDPIEDAIVPRALRATKSSGPLFVIGVVLIVLLLGLILWVFIAGNFGGMHDSL